MVDSRTKNTKRNIIFGWMYKIMTLLLPFLNRTVILAYLGAGYVGISGLFSSIIQVLSLAELGFSSAIVFSLYKPISDGDTDTVCALLNYFKRIYKVVGLVFFGGGLLLLPFLEHLVSGSYPSDVNIYILYLMYIFESGISYFLFGYKSAIITAQQREDILSKLHILVAVLKNVLQFALLLIFKNFYLYVISSLVTTVLNNILIAIITNKYFPEYKCRGSIEKKKKSDIRKQVFGLLFSKVAEKTRNSVDTVIISAFWGLGAVAIFNNYFMIFASVFGIVFAVSSGMQASVGNSIAQKTSEENYKGLKNFKFMYFWISCWFSTCLLCLYQPFMSIWAGEDLMLPNFEMALFCVYFFAICLNSIRNVYFEGCGLWSKAKKTYLLETIVNIILNIVLGKMFGIAGILIATIFVVIVINGIMRTYVLFKNYFNISPIPFLATELIYFISFAVVGAITYFVCSFITQSGITELVLKGLLCVVLPNVIMVCLFFKTDSFKKMIGMVKQIIKV